ncbi:uracil-DNA glycosylase [Aquimarina muelleri]|uniref:Uracil-DNA glycosylase n=1 Tax=Aquimarina muelleri TaxID=279356 RepID=A0A918JWY3_9FLAO|nr:uracil-DNA glycosylase [Aquimarina muelleri]MCX2762913.1 uracil-DNA glycosylase [Aquimarina muelleri]GGX27220.1 uracil-DNA glycosylase 2 [Aquimarina muelleri]
MNVNIESSWNEQLKEEFSEPYFNRLADFVKTEFKNEICYPKGTEVFAAFDYCTFEDVKVVIIGQDPYHGPGQANGLCFSVANNIQTPPSLINIFKEIETDIGVPFPSTGNLERWAKQGVLLLNATLTVRANQAGSHQNKGWEQFTDKVIQIISEKKNKVVFLLWGGYAKKKGAKINKSKHCVLTSGHPSPLSANRGYWFGNKHFSQTNSYLLETNQTPIKW